MLLDPVADFCENSNEPWGSIKAGKILYNYITMSFSRATIHHTFSYNNMRQFVIMKVKDGKYIIYMYIFIMVMLTDVSKSQLKASFYFTQKS